jgi:hypothetical protein
MASQLIFHSYLLRKLLRRSLEIWASPAKIGNPHSKPSMARTKQNLARILFMLADHIEEAQVLHREACEYVKEQLGVEITDDEDAEKAVDSLVFHGSQ